MSPVRRAGLNQKKAWGGRQGNEEPGPAAEGEAGTEYRRVSQDANGGASDQYRSRAEIGGGDAGHGSHSEGLASVVERQAHFLIEKDIEGG